MTAPVATAHDMDALIADILRHCGYLVDTFEHHVTEILTAAPQVVEDYRAAGHARCRIRRASSLPAVAAAPKTAASAAQDAAAGLVGRSA